MRLLRRCSSLGGCCVLLLVCTDASLGSPIDPAPIADEVVQRLVREPLQRRARPPSDSLERHLDEALTLLDRIEVERRGQVGLDDHGPVQTTSDMLLASKLHELTLVR